MNEENPNFKILFQIGKVVKFAKYFLPFISIGIIYQFYEIIGINNLKGVATVIIVILLGFSLMMLDAFIDFEKHKSKPKQVLIIVFILILMATIVLIISCTFFDYPKSLNQIINSKSKQEQQVEPPIGEPTKNVISFQIAGSFYDDCKYPFVYPDSILNAKKSDLIVKAKIYSDSTYENFSKAPAWISGSGKNFNRGYFGFYVPFHITSNNIKKILSLNNKFRVRIKVDSIVPKYVNVGSSCAGDMDFHSSKDIVILSKEKSEYWQDVSFNKADFYTSEPNEQNSFEIYFKIKDPAKYTIQIEIPYTFNQKRYFESFKIPDFIAPLSYVTWVALMPDNQIAGLVSGKAKHIPLRKN